MVAGMFVCMCTHVSVYVCVSNEHKKWCEWKYWKILPCLRILYWNKCKGG